MNCRRELLVIGGICFALAGCTADRDRGAVIGHAGPRATTARLTLDTPISQICDDPHGRTVLDRDLPTLRENPNYFLFKGMSLRQLASMSSGRITQAKLDKVQIDLAAGSEGATRRTPPQSGSSHRGK